MFILPGLIALVIFIYARPTDFLPAIRDVPFLYLFFGLAVFGFLVDIRLGKTKLVAPPQGTWAMAFYAWCVVTMLLKGREELSTTGLGLTIALSIFALIAIGISSFKAFEALAATVLACTLFLSALCVHQGLQPLQCIAMQPGESFVNTGRPDGRTCDTPATCRGDVPASNIVYRCEHVGMFGTTSVGEGRVRYIGILQDPNDSALAVSISVPLAFAIYQRKRTPFRGVVAALAFLLASGVVVMSRSRGGQLVFLSVLGVYFLKRFGAKGLLLITPATLPILLLGGRSGGDADASKQDRLYLLMDGLEMFKQSPILGVGCGRFTQHSHLTAHNSYVLAAAELGIPGIVTWYSLLYASIKTAFRSSNLVTASEGQAARIWGFALLSALTGLSVGIFFLSFNYHYVFWVYVGMTGALAGAITRHLPTFRVNVTPKELCAVTAFGLLSLLLIFVYVKVKLF